MPTTHDAETPRAGAFGTVTGITVATDAASDKGRTGGVGRVHSEAPKMFVGKFTARCIAITISVLATSGSAQASLTLGPPNSVAEVTKTARVVIKSARFTSVRTTPRARTFSPRLRAYGSRC